MSRVPDNRPPEVKLRMEQVGCPDCGVESGQSCSNRVAWPCLRRWCAAARAGLLPMVGRPEPNVLHRTGRGWHAAWSRRIVPKLRLPGDEPGQLAALHALSKAGLLALNNHAADAWVKPCPRCGRDTATWRDVKVSVCTACRAERLAESAPSLGEWNRSVYGRQP
jgi:hypothetical protein